MCGRFGIEPDLPDMVEIDFDTSFQFAANSNICPTQLLPTLIASEQGFKQLNGNWGIHPAWSKKLLINAQSETVDQKPTFKNSYLNYRCIIPMSYWYEWCVVEGQAKKVKHKFSASNHKPLYMAGIYFPGNNGDNNIISLTTKPNSQCKPYHHRMPMLTNKKWLTEGLTDIQDNHILTIIPDIEVKQQPALF